MKTLVNKEGLKTYVQKMVQADNRKIEGRSLSSSLSEFDSKIENLKVMLRDHYEEPGFKDINNNGNSLVLGTDAENGFAELNISGNTLVNLVPVKVPKLTFTGNGTPQYHTYRVYSKSNTRYTIFATVEKNTIDHNFGIVGWHTTNDNSQVLIPNGFLGSFCSTFRTGNAPPTNWVMDCWKENTQGEIVISNVFVLEGDWTNVVSPGYFEGLKSVGEGSRLNILSLGKNLFNNNIPPTTTQSNVIGGGYKTHRNTLIKYDPNKEYCVSYKKRVESHVCYCYVTCFDENGEMYYWNTNVNNFGKIDKKRAISGTPSYISVDIRNITLSGTTIDEVNNSVYDIQVEEGEQSTQYEDYKENRMEFLIGEPLRSVPYGVRDTIEKIGEEWKIIRRCGEWNVTATEPSWTKNFDYSPAQGWSGFNFKYKTNDIFNDKNRPKEFCKRTGNNEFGLFHAGHTSGNRGMDFHENGNGKLTIESSIVPVGDLVKLREWLSNNPTKIVYELEKPYMEDINPLVLQSWKNGVIQLDTIIPTDLGCNIPTNGAGQIERNITELNRQKIRLNNLEQRINVKKDT